MQGSTESGYHLCVCSKTHGHVSLLNRPRACVCACVCVCVCCMSISLVSKAGYSGLNEAVGSLPLNGNKSLLILALKSDEAWARLCILRCTPTSLPINRPAHMYCMRTNAHTDTYTHVQTRSCIPQNQLMQAKHAHARTHAQTHTHTHACTHTHAHSHTHTRTQSHTHTQLLVGSPCQ